MKKSILCVLGLVFLLAGSATVAVNANWAGNLTASQQIFLDDDPNDSEPETALIGGATNCLIDDDPNEPGPESTAVTAPTSFIDEDPNEPEPESTPVKALNSFIDEDPNEPEPEPEND